MFPKKALNLYENPVYNILTILFLAFNMNKTWM